ncbi:MAG TPA: DNA polymerase III subunit delta [Ktedonobacterales bacterium]|nr:DNA polymerase III subunit delta [Ktedonobacterales bacterium]
MFILLSGDEEFSAHEELARIRASADFGYNQDFFAGEDADLAAIRNACDTMPFLAEKRLVVLEGLPKPPKGKGNDEEAGGDNGDNEDSNSVSDAPVAPAPKGKRGKKAATTGLGPRAFAQGVANFVPTLPETTLLVALVLEKLKPDHPLMQAAHSHGKSHVFTTPQGAQLQDWVMRRARSQKRRLSAEAARMLVELLGDNLRMLANEIDKLSVYVGEGNEISAEDVRALTPFTKQSKVFDLTDALARRDTSAALTLLHELLAQGESPLGIVALTAFQTRAMMQVKRLSERGMSTFQIAQTAGLAPFVVEKSLPAARKFTFAQLEAAHRTLLEIDTTLKRSRMTPELALDLLVLEFGKVV